MINLSSVAATYPYKGGAVYAGSKAFVRQFSLNLRADLTGTRVRVSNVEPGLCSGTEFSNVRFKGDEEAAKAPYEGVEPLTAEDVAECVLFTLTRPLHVNIDELVIKALAQSSGGRILRSEA